MKTDPGQEADAAGAGLEAADPRRSWIGSAARVAGWLLGVTMVAAAVVLAVNPVTIAVVSAWQGTGSLIPLALWRPSTLVLCALLLAIFWAHSALPGWRSGLRASLPGSRRARWIVRALPIAAAAGLVAWQWKDVSLRARQLEATFDASLGMFRNGASKTFEMQTGPYRYSVRTNQYGFRDDDWTREAQPGTVRFAIVGDSFTFGQGIDDPAGLVDRCIERELARIAPERTWEVLNLGTGGLGIRAEAVLAAVAIRSFGPRIVVLSLCGQSDYEPYDFARQRELFGTLGMTVLDRFGVADDLKNLGVQATHLALPTDPVWPPFAGIAFPALEALGHALDESDVDLVVWDSCSDEELLGPLAGHPRVRSQHRPAGSPLRDGWNDPRWILEGDGHPTAAFNAEIAKTLAPVLRDLYEAQRL